MAKVIGITGGIGSGKSTVSKLLSEKLNAPILDADKIAKQVMESKEIINLIKKFFGEVIFDNPALINREKLSNIVFSSEERLLQLNKIVHPLVMEKIYEKVEKLKKEYSYILLDVPLPNEDFVKLSDKIIVVVANEENRIKRVMERSGLSKENVSKRISKQMPTGNYIKLADYVVKNNGDLEELEAKIDEIFTLFSTN